MPTNSVLSPFPTFFDVDGSPLEGGLIYVGQPGFEARSTPKASFFDANLTIATGTASGAAIRTKGGFPINNSNAPTMFYVDGDFSISVCDRNGVLLYSALNFTFSYNVGGGTGPILGADGSLGAVGIGFVNEANTGFVRSGAGTMQTVIGGTLVAQQTSAGTVFQQPVSGAGFNSGVLAVAQPVDADLTAVAGLSGTGIAVRTAANTWAQRQITSPDGSISITNPAGIAGDIQLSATDTIVGLLTTTGAATVGPWTLPAGIRRFTVTSNESSLLGSTVMLVQLRVAGSFVTTGYDAQCILGAGGNINSTTGMCVNIGAATNYWKGVMDFFLHDPATNLWVARWDGHVTNTATDAIQGNGEVALAGAVDGVRIFTAAGTFDAASFNVSY